MSIHADKTQKNNTATTKQENAKTETHSSNGSTFQISDNRPEAILQRKIQTMADNSLVAPIQKQENEEEELQIKSASVQKKENNTGLPDNLKSGIENLSGYAMDDVKVYYNSDQPAQLNAHAYAQGTDIHLSSGQEKHLPHEAWHVVQQKQGRVKPTLQMKGKVNVNDDVGLEKEADVMGRNALHQSHVLAEKKSRPETHENSQRGMGIVPVYQPKLIAYKGDKKAHYKDDQTGELFEGLSEEHEDGWVAVKSLDTDTVYTYFFSTGTYETMDYKIYDPVTGTTMDMQEKDRKGNKIADTFFEANVANIIFKNKDLYNLHHRVAQDIAGKSIDIETDEIKAPHSTNKQSMKGFMERTFVDKLKGDDKGFYWKNYDELRSEYLDDKDYKPRGRIELPRGSSLLEDDERDEFSGPMTPKSGRKFLSADDDMKIKEKLGVWKEFVAPEKESDRNASEKKRQQLGIPFSAGPSGSMVYGLSTLRTFKRMNPKHEINQLDERAYALSLAAYLVRQGHHSFFEALAPLKLPSGNKQEFYMSIVGLLIDIGNAKEAKEVSALYDRYFDYKKVK